MRTREIIIGLGGMLVGILLSSAVVVIAGNLDAPGGPTAPEAQMYTLAQIYDRLTTGSTAEKMTAFTQPTSGPGSTMPTLNEIMAAAPATHTHAATQTHVLSGTVTWGLSEGAWGVITGTRPYAPVPKTGQTTIYTTADDGDLQMGVAWPNPRFTDNGDGTVTDNLTGLIWLKDANCDGAKTWSNAIVWANDLYDGCMDCGGTDNDCGLSDGSGAGDWRLSNVQELQSLVHYGYHAPALPNTAGTGQWTEGDPFISVQSTYYWVSTTYAHSTSVAWDGHLSYGSVSYDNKSDVHYAWPVRGRQ